jgi:hypothetical protein
MTDDNNRALITACRALSPHLRKSTETSRDDLSGEGVASWLRSQADQMQALDAAIDRFRAALSAFDEGGN